MQEEKKINIKRFIESLPLQLNVTERFNCPICNHYNTFSVTKKVDGVYWFCFHNSCKTKGRISATIGKKELSNYFTNEEAKTEEFKIPDEWHRYRCIDYGCISR